MRQRSTWQGKGSETARQAATQRRADDIYDMNGEHPQPSPVDYANGDPDKWAETPASYDRVEAEYEAGHVKRNEIGLPDFNKSNFDGSGSKPWGNAKYDNRNASDRKVAAATKIASAILGGSDSDAVRQVATAVMAMPDKAILATLKAMNASSPASLPQGVRFKRAVACTKLAARILGSSATEATVEKLARCLFQINDSHLRPIVKLVASVKVAQEEEQEEEQEQEEEEEQEEEQEQEEGRGEDPPTEQHAQQEQEEGRGEDPPTEQHAQQEQQGGGDECLTAEEEAMLANMIGEGDGDLAELFQPAPAAPMAPMAPAAPAGAAPGISFDDDDASPAHPSVASLEDLFNDDAEVKAQREINASQRTGYDVRTASTAPKGAKKLGAVQASKKATIDTQLESIWDRP